MIRTRRNRLRKNRSRRNRTSRNQRGGLFESWFAPRTSTLHQIISNNNDRALKEFFSKLTEENKKEIVNKIHNGVNSLTHFINLIPNNSMDFSQLKPILYVLVEYANLETLTRVNTTNLKPYDKSQVDDIVNKEIAHRKRLLEIKQKSTESSSQIP